MPQPLYTEATLLAAMETAGKDIAEEALREAIKDQGLGTPATRAAIISTLLKREYVERSGKALVPTEKGLYIYDVVKDMQIADVEMTASWEEMLSGIEKRKVAPGTFISAVEIYTRQVTEEILSIKFPKSQTATITCPRCGTGNIIMRFKLAKCDNDACGLLVFRKFLNKELTDQHMQQLFSSGSTKLIKGFKGKKGNTFDAKLVFDKNYNLTFSFPKTKGKGQKKTASTKPRAGEKPKKKK